MILEALRQSGVKALYFNYKDVFYKGSVDFFLDTFFKDAVVEEEAVYLDLGFCRKGFYVISYNGSKEVIVWEE